MNYTKEEKIALLESKDYNPDQTIIFLTDKEFTHIIEPLQEGDFKLGVIEYTEEDKRTVHRSMRVEEGDEFKLQRGAMLDLTKPTDKIKWDWIKHYMDMYFVLGKGDMTPGLTSPKFYISVEEQEFKSSLKSSENKYEAYKLVNDTATDDLVKYAKLNGTPMKGSKPEVIRDLLYKLADKEPSKLISLYKEPIMITKFLLIELLEHNIISYSPLTSVYTFDNKHFAFGEEDCLNNLTDKKNKTTDAIKKKYDEFKIKQ